LVDYELDIDSRVAFPAIPAFEIMRRKHAAVNGEAAVWKPTDGFKSFKSSSKLSESVKVGLLLALYSQ
jgi:hypothetical protein